MTDLRVLLCFRPLSDHFPVTFRHLSATFSRFACGGPRFQASLGRVYARSLRESPRKRVLSFLLAGGTKRTQTDRKMPLSTTFSRYLTSSMSLPGIFRSVLPFRLWRPTFLDPSLRVLLVSSRPVSFGHLWAPPRSSRSNPSSPQYKVSFPVSSRLVSSRFSPRGPLNRP